MVTSVTDTLEYILNRPFLINGYTWLLEEDKYGYALRLNNEVYSYHNTNTTDTDKTQKDLLLEILLNIIMWSK